MSTECAHLTEERITREVILSKIPAFPPVVLRALDLLCADNAKIPELVRVITADPTLAAQVLRLANSALFAFTTKIGTVQHALTALGLGRVHALVVNIATTNYMRAALRTKALTSCWRHTLASAVLSRELARAARLEPERAYTLGLLHDIGRLGLLVAYPDSYDSLVMAANRDLVSLVDMEKHRFGMDHCETGRILLAEWGLPEEFGRVACSHHDAPQEGPFDMLQVVHFACGMADSLGNYVAEPVETREFEEWIGRLPAEVREPFGEQSVAVRDAVDRAIGEGQIVGHRAEPAARREAAAESAARAADRENWRSLRNRLPGWDRMMAVVTVALLAAVLLGLGYFALK